MLKVLVACEESQTVCKAFRELGHEAYSCDVVEPSGGHPEWHVKGDALALIGADASFFTMDGKHHVVDRWNLIIAHPPCTYLSNAGACRLYPSKGNLDKDRYKKGMEAKEFFMKFYDADCDHICIENPIPSKIFGLPKYTQTIQPYEYGHPYSKRTCLWLRGLPSLIPTEVLDVYKPYVSCGTSRNKGNPEKAGFSRAGGAAKVRSRTFGGVAQAMARQWSTYIEGKVTA